MTASSRAGGIAPPRFGVAVHILVLLALTEGVCPSAEIASQVQSHSTFLRRVLSPLVQSGIVEAREGRVGGYQLAKSADRITLGDVYTAITTTAVQATEGCDDEPDCGPRGAQLDLALGVILEQAEEQVVDFLSRFTIADLVRKVDL